MAKTTNFDAFFIKPTKSWRKPKIISVPDRHIVTVCNNPKLFGLKMKSDIAPVFKKFKEEMPFEGFARNEIILGLLKPPVNFVRIRYNARIGCWRLQIYENMNTSVCTSILHFLGQIKKGAIRDLRQLSSYPYYYVEIHDTKENSLFTGQVDASLEYVKKCQRYNEAVRKCYLLGASGVVTLESANLEDV